MPRAAAPAMVAGADAALLHLADAGAIGATADETAGALFGASLFPWLGALYWLGHPTVGAPKTVVFGLQYLLAFVFGTIPAAIAAGALFDASLADADFLHGSAESLLAITNCIVVLGFRDALSSDRDAAQAGADSSGPLRAVSVALGVLSVLSALAVFASGDASVHTPWLGGVGALPSQLWGGAEPANALSAPTWLIHTSSLVEWLVAMGLAWRYAGHARRAEWKGVTWGMLPLHTSGIVACTYHLFYNNPALSWMVTLQAATTCFGNTTLMLASLRLALASGWTWQAGFADAAALLAAVGQGVGLPLVAGGSSGGGEVGGAAGAAEAKMAEAAEAEAAELPRGAGGGGGKTKETKGEGGSLVGWEDLGDAWAKDGDAFFLLKLVGLSGALAYLAKCASSLVPYGSRSAKCIRDLARRSGLMGQRALAAGTLQSASWPCRARAGWTGGSTTRPSPRSR